MKTNQQKKLKGTALDYSTDLYKHYIEIIDVDNNAKNIIEKYTNKESVIQKEFGYEFEAPIQTIPEIIRALQIFNLAVYQIIRK